MARKIIKQNSSFGVLRANPRISGNVKITVDSKEDIWLNSIDSNPTMSNAIYKGFRISPDSSYDKDLYSFFREGQTPSQFVFGLKGEGDPVQNQTSDYSQIYDFTYSAGVTPLVSDKYPEDFSYLAPFWMGEDIPDYFVIFRMNDPIDYSYQVPVTSLVVGNNYKVLQDPTVNTQDPGYLPFTVQSNSVTYTDGNVFNATSTVFTVTQGQGTVVLLDALYHMNDVEDVSKHFYDKVLPKSTVVATFDMSDSSKIGKYLRNIKNGTGYTGSLIDVRFEDNQLTNFNGVNYVRGIFDKKGEYYLDYYTNPDTQIGFEEFITDGFQRNEIISYNLLNLEFLFSDDSAKNYTINRYYGMYVNAPEISNFKLSGDSLYKNNGLSGNTPVPQRNDKGYFYQNDQYFQYNDNGVRLFIDSNYINGVLPSSYDVNINEKTKLFWIQDKNNKFHSLKRDPDYLTTTSSYSKYGLTGSENQLVLQDTSINLGDLSGTDPDTKKQYEGVSTEEKGRAYSVIRIAGEFSLGQDDAFLFYHPLGTYGNTGEKYDIIRISDMSSMVDEWGPGSFYAQDNAYYFHPLGTNEEIAKAICGVFNSFNYNSFEAFQSGDEVIIRSRATGSAENNKYHLDFFQNLPSTRMPISRKGIAYINEKDVCDINRRQSFLGGSNYSVTRVKVKIEDANKIEIGKTFLETIKLTGSDTYTGFPDYTFKSASVVVGVYRFVDQYAKNEKGEIIGLKDFETHATLEVANYTEKVSVGSSNRISAFNTYQIPLGVFSFYGVRELDMDFWYSEYGYTPTPEYYKHLDTQPDGITKIVPGRSYYVASGATAIYNSSTYVGPKFFKGVAGKDSYTLTGSSTTADSNVYPTLSTRDITSTSPVASFDPSFYPDLDSFPGFYGIQDLKYIDSTAGKITKHEQMYFGKLELEYDYSKDNYNPQFAIKSRVSPYITKWVYRGGTDVRGNGYRLNSNIAFSPLNFSPSFFRRIQDPQYFTHEWYQLQRPPYSFPEDSLHKDKSYLWEELTKSKLIDANPANRDYFLDYFSVEGEDLSVYYPSSSTIEDVNITERYTTFKFNSGNGFPETVFRGAKVRIKRKYTDYTQNETTKFLTDDRFYDGYKFSCVLVPIHYNDKIQDPVKLRVVENRTFKNITLIVEVLVQDSRVLDFETSNVSYANQYLDLDYFLLYSLKDKLDSRKVTVTSPAGTNIILPEFGDVKLSSALNVTNTPTDAGLVSIVNSFTVDGSGIIYTINNPSYETDLRDEISFFINGSVTPPTTPAQTVAQGSLYANVTGGYYFPYPTGVGENYLNFTNTPQTNYEIDFSGISIGGPVSIPCPADYNTVSNIPIYQIKGGQGYWGRIFEKISFANISLMINTESPYIEYKTYVWNETTKSTDVLDNQFSLEFLKPSAFTQNAIIVTEEITDKPQEISLFNVGYNAIDADGESEIYRYSGEYVPKFREVIKFENVKNDVPDWVVPPLNTFTVKVGLKTEENTEYVLGSLSCLYIDNKEQFKITLVKGLTYTFDVSDSTNTGYQMYFSTNNIGNDLANDAITQGYTLTGTPGNPGASIQFVVPYDLPSTVYYVAEGGRYMGQKIYVVDPIEYSYCSFGPDKEDFGLVKNVNYYKYSKEWIFRISKDSPYNPVYTLIGETPVDKRNLGIFQSSWDPGFYREYLSSTTYNSLPGTRNMKEEKSFFGSKVMQTPDKVLSQKQTIYPTSLENVLDLNYDNYPGYEILWEETTTEIRGILLIDRMLQRFFLDDGAKITFSQFIVPEFGFGDLSNVDDDFNEYMNKNVIPIFQSKNNGAYIKKIPLANNVSLDPVIGNLKDYEKLLNGYFQSQDIKYNKINDLRFEFIVDKDPSFDYSVSFSIEIGKI